MKKMTLVHVGIFLGGFAVGYLLRYKMWNPKIPIENKK